MTIHAFLLADLITGDHRQRLEAAIMPEAQVNISCAWRERLPISFLAMVIEITARKRGFVRLDELSIRAKQALQMIDRAGVLGVRDETRAAPVIEPAFTLAIDERGELLIRTRSDIGQHHPLSEQAAYDWLRGAEASAVKVDLGEVDHISSVLVAWLLHLSQAAAPSRLELIKLTPKARAQLAQLRLTHFMTIA